MFRRRRRQQLTECLQLRWNASAGTFLCYRPHTGRAVYLRGDRQILEMSFHREVNGWVLSTALSSVLRNKQETQTSQVSLPRRRGLISLKNIKWGHFLSTMHGSANALNDFKNSTSTRRFALLVNSISWHKAHMHQHNVQCSAYTQINIGLPIVLHMLSLY